MTASKSHFERLLSKKVCGCTDIMYSIIKILHLKYGLIGHI